MKQLQDDVQKLEKLALEKKNGNFANNKQAQMLMKQIEIEKKSNDERQEQNRVYIQTLEEEVLRQH